jgi:hypothetical protein
MAAKRKRNPTPQPGELKTIAEDASTHVLTSTTRKGAVVGALKTDVLEGLRAALGERLSAGAGAAADQLRADLRAINDERARRWLAFTAA